MTDDLERARPADRDLAIAAVEAAYASGRIVEHDRDLRIQQVQAASLRGEVQALVRDLPAPPSVPQHQPAASPVPVRRRRGTGGILVVAAVAAALVLGVVGTLTAFLADGTPETEVSSGGVEAVESRGVADLLTRRGYADLVDAVEQKTGRREAFDLVIYPDRATVSVPVDRRSRRYVASTWNGEWHDAGSVTRSSYQRFSLDDIDGGLLRRMVTKARRQIEDATTWYVVVRPPGASDRGTVRAYASNELGESAIVPVELDPRRRNP